MTRIILVRHGQSEANANFIFAGHSDFPLTEFGHKQAKLVAEYLAKNEKIDAIYSSDLKRAYYTAVPTAELLGMEIIKDTRLREVFAGEWESKPTSFIEENYPEDFNCWRNDFSHVRCTGGESIIEVYNRIVPAICEISKENDGRTVLITSHATVVRSFFTYAMGLPCDRTADSPAAVNASISVFEMDKGKVLSYKLNITDHLGDMISRVPTKFNA